MTWTETANDIVIAIEVVGVAVIVFGVVFAALYALYRFVEDRDVEEGYTRLRHGVGRSLMLGLDLLIASEIVRSISTETLESVAVLGLTVIIRTFLSLTLAVEIDGVLPWRRGRTRLDVESERERRRRAAAPAEPEETQSDIGP